MSRTIIAFIYEFHYCYFCFLIRFQKFPWGDGNHSFIHNPAINALPAGYETNIIK